MRNLRNAGTSVPKYTHIPTHLHMHVPAAQSLRYPGCCYFGVKLFFALRRALPWLFHCFNSVFAFLGSTSRYIPAPASSRRWYLGIPATPCLQMLPSPCTSYLGIPEPCTYTWFTSRVFYFYPPLISPYYRRYCLFTPLLEHFVLGTLAWRYSTYIAFFCPIASPPPLPFSSSLLLSAISSCLHLFLGYMARVWNWPVEYLLIYLG